MSSIDSIGRRPLGGIGSAIRPGLDRRIAIGCFGGAALIGLIFAFVGLDLHSFWFDELFTARLLEPLAGTTLMSRIATDVHPPVYLVALSLFSQVFSDDDLALRAFSAVAACGAIAVFVATTRTAFSLPARLFGAALATGSLFWFFQAQNVRSYALCLVLSAGILAIGLRLLHDGQRRSPPLLAALFGLMLLGSFSHFYMMYVALGVLGMIVLLQRQDRAAMVAAATVLLVAVGLYVKFVIEPYARVSLANNWYPSHPGWYLAVLQSCLRYTFHPMALAALGLCGAAILAMRRRAESLWPDRVTLFLLGVPLTVVAGGIASSVLMAPSFFDRNVLVVSPFLWALAARAYDAAVEKASPAIRLALNGSLGVIALSMTGIVASRLPSGEAPAFYEPYRQSAHWIQTLSACRGQTLPVVTVDSPDWYKPGYAAFIYEAGYGRYLQGFATPQLVFASDLTAGRLPADLAGELRRRLDGQGCPVLAWSAHNMNRAFIAAIEERLLGALGRPDAAGLVAVKPFTDGSSGYVLYLRGQGS